jgi:hypothetical protein
VGTLASELRPIAAGLAAAPRIYADANIPLGLVTTMRAALKWDVLFVLEDETLRRARDASHFSRALELGRTLVTLDRDFLDFARFPESLSPGVVVCSAPDEPGLARLLARLDRHLRARGADVLPLRGRTLLLTPDAGWVDE